MSPLVDAKTAILMLDTQKKHIYSFWQILFYFYFLNLLYIARYNVIHTL